MRILIVHNTVIPVKAYGGIERIVWYLGKELVSLGHKVSYLVPAGSSCPFAECLVYDPSQPVNGQIPDDIDLVHLHFQVQEQITKPYLISCHTNYHAFDEYDINTVFISQNHANRNGSEVYVYNGVDIEELGDPGLDVEREYLLFLGYAKRPEKNLKACKVIARGSGNKLVVVGLKDKWYRRFDRRVTCKGFLGGDERNAVIRKSKALLFPVLWHEPFGLAMIECMYFGCPVFGTAYGALSEIIQPDVGVVSNKATDLIQAARNVHLFNRRRCHEYVCDQFTSKHMTHNYLHLYQKVLNGEKINLHPPKNGGNFSPDELLPDLR